MIDVFAENGLGQLYMTYFTAKRAIDILVALALLILLSPLMFGLYIAVSVTSSGPAIFWSDRVGANKKLFSMPKYRTMVVEAKLVSPESADPDDIKPTAFGKILRKTSLDELPQLWSVLIGDMSLIGPRPMLEFDNVRDERYKRPEIFNLKPGITGLAQVSGRNFISPKNKSRYDAFYVKHISLALDIKIALMTIGTVLKTNLVK